MINVQLAQQWQIVAAGLPQIRASLLTIVVFGQLQLHMGMSLDLSGYIIIIIITLLLLW